MKSRFGVIFDEKTTKKLMALCNYSKEDPNTFLVECIDNMFRSVENKIK
jgi:hypothetical protein